MGAPVVTPAAAGPRRPGTSRPTRPRARPLARIGRIGRIVGRIAVTIWGSTLVAFLILNALPGDPAAGLLGVNATPEAIANLRDQLRLDEPMWDRYWSWLAGAVHGDLGSSLVFRQGVTELITQRLPVTAELFVLGMLFSAIPAFVFASAAAVRPGGIVDRALTVATSICIAVPDFVLALLFVLLFAVTWHLLPPLGYVPFAESPIDNLRYMLMPALAVASSRFAVNARMLRAELVTKVAISDYAMAARAKGMSQAQVIARHGVRNGSFAVAPIIGVNVAPLLGGAVVMEPIFGLPGLGDLLVSSVYNRDAPVVQAVVVLFALLVVLGGFAADRLGNLLDPRTHAG